MKLEYLDDISDGGKYTDVFPEQLIRLYNFDSVEAKMLSDQIRTEILEKEASLDLGSLNFIEALNCNLELRLSQTSFGIRPVDDCNFKCDLTIADFEDMLQRIEPFYLVDQNVYQWLYDIDTPIEFLFSPGGSW